MRITNESKAMMIRQILNKLEDQRDRIERIDDGREQTRQLLADYRNVIVNYQAMDPAMFNACQYPDILAGLAEIDTVIRDRERILSTREQKFLKIEVTQ